MQRSDQRGFKINRHVILHINHDHDTPRNSYMLRMRNAKFSAIGQSEDVRLERTPKYGFPNDIGIHFQFSPTDSVYDPPPSFIGVEGFASLLTTSSDAIDAGSR